MGGLGNTFETLFFMISGWVEKGWGRGKSRLSEDAGSVAAAVSWVPDGGAWNGVSSGGRGAREEIVAGSARGTGRRKGKKERR